MGIIEHMFVSAADIEREGPADDEGRVLFYVFFADCDHLGEVLVDMDRAAQPGVEAWIARRLNWFIIAWGPGVVRARAGSGLVVE